MADTLMLLQGDVANLMDKVIGLGKQDEQRANRIQALQDKAKALATSFERSAGRVHMLEGEQDDIKYFHHHMWLNSTVVDNNNLHLRRAIGKAEAPVEHLVSVAGTAKSKVDDLISRLVQCGVSARPARARASSLVVLRLKFHLPIHLACFTPFWSSSSSLTLVTYTCLALGRCCRQICHPYSASLYIFGSYLGGED